MEQSIFHSSHRNCQAKKGQNIYNKAQFESPKYLHQTTFETLKYWQKITQSGHHGNVHTFSEATSILITNEKGAVPLKQK